MPTQRVGTCSLCSGDVYGHRGPWMGTTPPAPDRCVACGAVRDEDVIVMRPSRRPPLGARICKFVQEDHQYAR